MFATAADLNGNDNVSSRVESFGGSGGGAREKSSVVMYKNTRPKNIGTSSSRISFRESASSELLLRVSSIRIILIQLRPSEQWRLNLCEISRYGWMRRLVLSFGSTFLFTLQAELRICLVE